MLAKYHKNAVLHGCLDYFCLACEAHLKTEEDVNLHIEKPIHKKNLGLSQYVDSCIEDRIRKVKKRYYCERCNILLPTITKVHLHTKEAKHEFNKSDDSGSDAKRSLFLKWVRNSVVALDELLIGEQAWHGLVDETCVVCDTEFEDAALHRSEVSHMLRVVQARVQVGSDNFISRKIDDTTYQCLTCNTVISHAEMITHYDKPEHTKLYLECLKAKRALATNDLPKDETKTEAKKKEEPKKEEKKTETKIKEEPKKQQPKKVEATDKKDAKQQTKKEAEKKAEKSEVIPKLVEEEISPYDRDVNEVLGTKEYLKILPGNLSALCLLCDWSIDIFSISQHLNGQHHQTMLSMQKTRADEKRKAQVITNTEVPEEKKTEKPVADEANKSKIIDSIQSFQKNDILIDLISEKAFCKKCSNNVDYVFDVIEKHIESHKTGNGVSETNGVKYPAMDKSLNKTEVKRPEPEKPKAAEAKKPVPEKPKAAEVKKPEPEKTKAAAKEEKPLPAEDIETYAKDNEITYHKAHNRAYCRLCETRVPPTLRCFKEHVQGSNHQMKKNKPEEVVKMVDREESLYNTKPMEEFVNEVTMIENIFRKDCVVNDEICVSAFSFLMLTKLEVDKFRCQVCEKSMMRSEVGEHVDTKKHQRFMKTTKVLYTLDNQFVREVRPNVFHCGFCNLIEPGWTNLQHHLNSSSHRHLQQGCEWLLQEHMPSIREHRRRKIVEFMFLMRMLTGKLF